MERIHATCVVIKGHGVLLRGESGSGKSDLALRLIDEGAGLVADDYTELSTQDGELFATVPQAIQGLLEVRGVGIVHLGCVPRVPVAAIFDLVPSSEVKRLPDQHTISIAGVDVAHYAIHGLDASAPAKVRMALKAQTEKLFHST
ncbi:HPr kinase/phosphatase C-terminal domain-containing protein [Magnetovibrio sp.]|uniref:HPr kinase/phosphorylase n=1 Tax=Magnetovibrio sp. TaxID=2024836 RepID=UPI002F95E070